MKTVPCQGPGCTLHAMGRGAWTPWALKRKAHSARLSRDDAHASASPNVSGATKFLSEATISGSKLGNVEVSRSSSTLRTRKSFF